MDINEEENTTALLEGDLDEESNKYEMCQVGRFLIERTINTRAMKSKLADVWRPAMGIHIKELEPGFFLFSSIM